MSDPNFHLSTDARLLVNARSDARRLTPAFSDALHARVIQAVENTNAMPLRIPQSAGRTAARYWAAPLALAAAVAMVVVPTLLMNRPSPVPIVSVRPLPVKNYVGAGIVHKPQLAVYSTAHDMNVRVQNVVQTAMAEEQFAGLDHDFRAATRYLANQVPLRAAWESAPVSGEQ